MNLFIDEGDGLTGGYLDAYTSSLETVWSTRLRLTSYSGPLIRVRRSADNAEQDVGFTGSGALDVADLVSFVGAGTGYVRRIYDQTGNGNTLQNNSGTSTQPVIVSSGTYVSGGVHWVASNSCFMQSSANCPAVNAISVFGWMQVALGGVALFFETTDGSGAGDQLAFYHDTSRYNVYVDDGANVALSQYPATLTTGKAFGIIADRSQTGISNKEKYSELGVQLVAGSTDGSTGTVGSGSTFTAAPWNVGARNGSAFFVDMYLKSLVVYNASKIADFAAIESQLQVA